MKHELISTQQSAEIIKEAQERVWAYYLEHKRHPKCIEICPLVWNTFGSNATELHLQGFIAGVPVVPNPSVFDYVLKD